MDPVETACDAPLITFDLTTCVTVDGRTAISLHLFRDGSSALTRMIATVEHGQAVPVLLKCRQDLKRRGIPPEEDVSMNLTRRTATLA